MAQDARQGDGSPGARHVAPPLPRPPQAEAREELSKRLEGVARINLRPLASPLPMGFIGLAAATLLVSALNLGWIPATQGRIIAFGLLVFVVPLQGTASVFGTLTRDGVAATGMAILTGTWATVALTILTSPPGSTSKGLGVLLVLSAVAMLLVAVGASLGKLVPAVVLLGASLRFATAAVYQLSASHAWKVTTGWVGVVLGVLALYAAFGALLENLQGRTVLPMGRRRKGRQAVEGGLAEQLLDVVHEPGVRVQL
jgi:succinate-acetate transporter protein